MSVAIPVAPRTRPQRRRFLGLFGPSSAAQPLISHDASSPFAESFRLLALNVQTMLAYDARKAVAVMSSYANEGRSLVAANLALALAEQQSVLLVDERRLAGAGNDSLSELFHAGADGAPNQVPGDMRRSIMESAQQRVYVMPRVPGDDGTGALDQAIAQASDAGMYTIIDTPPALAASAAFEDARMAGNALYIVQGGTTDLDAHRRVREQLERLNVNILGILLNEH